MSGNPCEVCVALIDVTEQYGAVKALAAERGIAIDNAARRVNHLEKALAEQASTIERLLNDAKIRQEAIPPCWQSLPPHHTLCVKPKYVTVLADDGRMSVAISDPTEVRLNF